MFGREHGVKIGSGGMATDEMIHAQRKDRLRQVVSEVFDIDNDPYFMRNTAGKIVCKLCETSHPNEQNYIMHTNSMKHRQNLVLRQKKLNKGKAIAVPLVEKKKVQPRKTEKIGRPGYNVYRQYCRQDNTHSLLLRIMYPEIAEGTRPRFKIMSTFEQKVEPTDARFQYLLIAAEPYETIAFKIPAGKIDRSPSRFLTHWNEDTTTFTLQLHYLSTVHDPATIGGEYDQSQMMGNMDNINMMEGMDNMTMEDQMQMQMQQMQDQGMYMDNL